MAELRHLHTPWDVDRRIVLDSADKLVIIRFSSYESPPAELLFAATGSAAGADGGGDSAKRRRLEGADDAIFATGSSGAPPLTSSTPTTAVASAEHYLRTQQMDAMLVLLAPKVRKYCTIYAVDTNEVPQFNDMYELGHDRDPFAVMFFYRNQHIRVDVGTGNNNKINFFAFEDMEEDFLPIVNAAYRAGKIGKNMTSVERKFSTVALRR